MKLSLCIAGCGGYARQVMQDLGELAGDYEFYFASRDAEKARSYSDTYGGAGYFGSYEEAASDSRVQALYFCTPHHVHLDNALLAARNSKHVLMEKPIARTVDEAAEMVRAAHDGGVKLMVAENFRFLPAVESAREMIVRGNIGTPRLVEIHIEGYREPVEWRTQAAEMGGGVFIDGGIHFVDILASLGGLPERVYASRPPQVFSQVEGEDGMVMIAHLPGGAVGLINFSTATPVKERRQWVIVTGTKGQLRFAPFGDEVEVETPEVKRTVRVTEARRGIPGMLREFGRCVLDGRESVMSGEEGLRDLAVVLAAYRSVNGGQAVSLDDILPPEYRPERA